MHSPARIFFSVHVYWKPWSYIYKWEKFNTKSHLYNKNILTHIICNIYTYITKAKIRRLKKKYISRLWASRYNVIIVSSSLCHLSIKFIECLQATVQSSRCLSSLWSSWIGKCTCHFGTCALHGADDSACAIPSIGTTVWIRYGICLKNG